MKPEKVVKAANERGMYFVPNTGDSKYYTLLTIDGYIYCETLKDAYRIIKQHKKPHYTVRVKLRNRK